MVVVTEELEHRLDGQVVPAAPVDERAARRTLRAQIARLEGELGAAFTAAFPRSGLDWSVPACDGPRLLSLGELEIVRDDLADRLAGVRADLAQRAEREDEARLLIERMLSDPASHKWVRVTNADLGLPGCRNWHVRPRLGLVGMLMGWWRVKVSSGCPLPGGPAPRRRPRLRRSRADMGRRSRKRSVATARERSAPRPAAAPPPQLRPRRRSRSDEAPPAPWGAFPLAELCVLLALILGVVGVITWGRSGQTMLVAATALGSLAGLEVAIREHFAGYRSHSLVLAGAGAVLVMAVLFFAGVLQGVVLAVGVAVFAAAFGLLRGAFRRRSGGLSFR